MRGNNFFNKIWTPWGVQICSWGFVYFSKIGSWGVHNFWKIRTRGSKFRGDLTPPPVYLSHRVLSSHGWTTLHIWHLTPVRDQRMGLTKPKKWVSSFLLLDCANLVNTRPNAKEYQWKTLLCFQHFILPKNRGTTWHLPSTSYWAINIGEKEFCVL